MSRADTPGGCRLSNVAGLSAVECRWAAKLSNRLKKDCRRDYGRA